MLNLCVFMSLVYTAVIEGGGGVVFTHSLRSVQNEYLNLYVVFAQGFVCMPYPRRLKDSDGFCYLDVSNGIHRANGICIHID
jgi:hypothetical protein